MPTIATIDVPTAQIAQRVAAAFKSQFKPQYDAAKLANPALTDAQFYKLMLVNFTKEIVKAAEANAAAEIARVAALATAENEVNPT